MPFRCEVPKMPQGKVGYPMQRGSGVLLALILGILVAACERSPVQPEAEVYTLATVNGAPLPAPFSPSPLSPPVLEVTSGTLTLRPDGTLTAVMFIRCSPSLPPGTNCEITGDGREEFAGSYSRSEGWVRFDEASFVQFATVFEASRLTVSYGFPPSFGLPSPYYELEYRR